jgi:tripartite-type tricarboxylate transporter receptor subunit TctC
VTGAGPIGIVVPFGSGRFAEFAVRLLAQKLAERTSAQVVIEKRRGAGGILVANAVTSAEPDGDTQDVLARRCQGTRSYCQTVMPAWAKIPGESIGLIK